MKINRYNNKPRPQPAMKPMKTTVFLNCLLTALALLLPVAAARAQSTNYTWDASGSHPAVPTDGAGTWDYSHANWTNNGADVVFGANAGASPVVAYIGNTNGTAGIITVGTITNLYGIQFGVATSGSYVLTNGTLNFVGPSQGITYWTNDANVTIWSTIAGTNGFYFNASSPKNVNGSRMSIFGANTVSGNNSVSFVPSGQISVGSGTYTINSIASNGIPSSFGTNGTVNLLQGNTTVNYVGGAAATDRLFEFGHNLTFNNNGTGALAFYDTDPCTDGGGNKWLTFGGTYKSSPNLVAAGFNNLLHVFVTGGTWNFSNPGFNMNSLSINSGCTVIQSGLNNYNYQGANGIILNGAFVYTNAGNAQTIAGVISGTGSITNQAGTLTLSGANTFSGAAVISGGTLALAGTFPAASISIGAGATLDVSAIDPYLLASKLTCTTNATINGATSVNFGNQSFTLNYDGTDAPLTISQGALTLGNNVITVNGPVLGAGTYVLIATPSTPTIGTPTVTGTAIPAIPFTSTVSVSGNNVVLTVVNAASAGLNVWNVGNGVWDTSTANWKGSSTKYANGATVVFDDTTAAGAGNYTVTLNSTVNPTNVSVNVNTNSYTLSGTGSIAGAGGLTKAGTNTLTLATANSYTGGTLLNAGTLIVNATNALGTGLLNMEAGTLIVNATNALGTGLNMDGGTATVNATNALGTGLLTLNSGTLIVNAPNIIGTGLLTLNGGMLSNNATSLCPTPVNMAGASAVAVSANNSLTITGVITNTGSLTMSGAGTLI